MSIVKFLGRQRTDYNRHTFLGRFKRDTKCRYWANEFECRDGTCITADRKCDGTIDCPDGTDEKHYLCRKTECPDYLFRCTYGACVDGTASCNGVSDCVDNSDELQPKCNNNSAIIGDKFKCDDGNLVELYTICDAIKDCKDGSDETLKACAGNICPSNLFQCAYGACVDEGVDCDDIDDCADGSDESDILCNRRIPRTTTTTTIAPTTSSTTTVQAPTMCVLPPHPKNGIFLKNGDSATYRPGEVIATAYLNITCMPGYKVVGDKVAICYWGTWYPYSLPSCIRACELPPSESVVYRCLIREAGAEGTRECDPLEAEGTVVQPECRRPNYYNPTILPYMFCVDGRWSQMPVCEPECGTLTPVAEPLVAGGHLARRGEVPWHITIYELQDESYQQICGGSLVSEKIVISASSSSASVAMSRVSAAAHCFWLESYGVLPPDMFAAAAGKLYRLWDDPRDQPYAQFSLIKDIILASHFGGAELLYQDDLAIVKISNRFTFRTYIRPVCLNFSPKFNEFQLRSGNIGKVAGFGLTSSHRGSESPELKVVELPYVEWEECKQSTPPEYRSFIIGTKFCAGYLNDTAVCKGDSGGGLAFSAHVMGEQRFYLRGVVSTSPHAPDGAPCYLRALTAFTALQPYKDLVREHLD
ncbi:unnamed protein product [Euphydryas editha]|uniref:Uncharacterized protein n=1 Tax=Euphydryas editha TaxID=104508 RepID=A0AAU9UQZ8_EUPED|nr:unnamed protein product [Euphydryas editha]